MSDTAPNDDERLGKPSQAFSSRLGEMGSSQAMSACRIPYAIAIPADVFGFGAPECKEKAYPAAVGLLEPYDWPEQTAQKGKDT
ncbi:hypothetical protein [Streptomyces sp. YGL11-2]|uniref:hypothetical protein n=1 Tax=Streptomyces sp. YGL11-2 TaxID=3414028 RepID=UPI003CE93CE6